MIAVALHVNLMAQQQQEQGSFVLGSLLARPVTYKDSSQNHTSAEKP